MSGVGRFATVISGAAFDRADVPRLSHEEFRREVTGAVARDLRLASFFGLRDEAGSGVELLAVLADDAQGRLRVCSCPIDGDTFRSLTPECPQAHLFEREIAEQTGVRPEGHPWLKPLRFTGDGSVVGVMDYYQVEGDEIHEVAVGPVHAGIIEPGHFRFQCHGEHVFHLEISLGYQHRGAERALVGGPDKRTIHYLETVAGDTTIGHATAYCEAVEGLAAAPAPPRGQVLRAIALELERLANHVGDLGALANDVGYLPTAAFCGRLRGDFLNLTAQLCGSRFGRGMVRPGGVGFDVDGPRVSDMLARLDGAATDTANAVNLLWDTYSVMARFEEVGVVGRGDAVALGLVGPAARACGLGRDNRHDHPGGHYRFAHVPVSTCESGDVFARAYVRWLEIQRSIVFIRESLQALPAGPCRAAPAPRMQPDRLVVTLVEGWRGEICHVAITGADGRFRRYKVTDPSFHNWQGLAMALRDQQISDFPLCNKSFNLSYCGCDL